MKVGINHGTFLCFSVVVFLLNSRSEKGPSLSTTLHAIRAHCERERERDQRQGSVNRPATKHARSYQTHLVLSLPSVHNPGVVSLVAEPLMLVVYPDARQWLEWLVPVFPRQLKPHLSNTTQPEPTKTLNLIPRHPQNPALSTLA